MAAYQEYHTAGDEYPASSCDALADLRVRCSAVTSCVIDIHAFWHSWGLYICVLQLLVTLEIRHTITATAQSKRPPSADAMHL